VLHAAQVALLAIHLSSTMVRTLLRGFTFNFEPDPAYPDLVPPVLAYADLQATRDGRNIEAANLILNNASNRPFALSICFRQGYFETASTTSES
jgi:hypothetical protein